MLSRVNRLALTAAEADRAEGRGGSHQADSPKT